MKKETESDPAFRTGSAFVVAGFLIIAAIWYVFLRPSQEKYQPPAIIPLTATGPDATLFEIVPNESGVRFTIDELLRGQPKTVVGVTRLVTGQIALNPDDLRSAQVGVIQANARSFYTDDAFRDEALQTFIIDSTTFPLVTFAPTDIDGLPERIEVGKTAVFSLSGDLTIRDITRLVTFDCTAVLISPTRLEGSAAATINRADFGLIIPQVAQVANVGESFLIEIEFVATAVEER